MRDHTASKRIDSGRSWHKQVGPTASMPLGGFHGIQVLPIFDRWRIAGRLVENSWPKNYGKR